jgi:hypothetical protein
MEFLVKQSKKWNKKVNFCRFRSRNEKMGTNGQKLSEMGVFFGVKSV